MNIPQPLPELLYEGKAKQVLPGPEAGQFIIRFKDSATAFNAKKKAEIEGKGSLNLRISSRIFEFLEKKGIRTHFLKRLSDREMLVRSVKIIPLEVVVRNLAAGSLCKRLGVKEKLELRPPLLEFYLKNDALDDPILTEDHIRILNLATLDDLRSIKEKSLNINSLMIQFFKSLEIILVDFKLEFGKTESGEILLADEISPDGCRLWDAKTMNILDKDRFRKDLGGLREAYEEIWKRIEKAGK